MIQSVDPPGGRICLVNMPMANPVLPSLAIEQLAQIGRDEGLECDILYGTLLLPASVPLRMFHEMSGSAIFIPSYFNQDDELVAINLVEEIHKQRHTGSDVSTTVFEASVAEYLFAMDDARRCLDRCMDAIPPEHYDVIGFSVAFDAQKLPSAALAKLLKRREPKTKIIFGGTGCDGPMGPALMHLFPEIDCVVQGDAEATFLPAVEALLGIIPCSAVPGLVSRDGENICINDEPVPFTDLHKIPPADYNAFLVQKSATSFANCELILMFETSRGCWWGKNGKRQCTFCGIRSAGLSYRSRQTGDALKTIRGLRNLFHPDLLYSTDAIIDLGHIQNVLPKLASERRALGLRDKLFFEVKTNMQRREVALLAAAGVTLIQPGIESLSTRVLKAMRKGVTALQQVEWLKWALTYGITPIYGILVGIPGETAADLHNQCALITALHHLPPPVAINRIALHRFSQYFSEPEVYGFRDIRPFPLQRLIYQSDDSTTLDLCYEHAYSLPDQDTEEMTEARNRLKDAVTGWRENYAQGSHLLVKRCNEGQVVIRRNSFNGTTINPLRGELSDLYDRCQSVTSVAQLALGLDCTTTELEYMIDGLVRDKLIVRDGNHIISIAVPTDADAWVDADLELSTSELRLD